MALNINGTTGISGVNGSASAPVLTGTDSNTGINFASDTVNINTGGTTRVIVDSSGNLRTGTITDTSGNNISTTTQIAKGRAKAWCHFSVSSGTPSLDDDFNFSSITDLGAGYFQFNFTNAMSNTNYASVSTSEVGSSNITIPVLQSGGEATDSIRFIYYRITNLAGGGTNVDPPAGAVVVFGEQ